MRLRERIRIEVAVQRVGWWLDWQHMPGRRRRGVLRELRASLADAAAAGELGDALARLGPPRAMAEAYVATERTGVRWRAGTVAAAFAFLAASWLVLAYIAGFTDGARAVGPELGETYEAGRGLVVGDRPLTSLREEEGLLVAGGTLLTWLHVGAVAAAFVLFARPWRALRRTASRRTVRAHG
jgi:hypothetical protein